MEVAIASVNAVFDWREYLAENFGYSWEEEEPEDEYGETFEDEPEDVEEE